MNIALMFLISMIALRAGAAPREQLAVEPRSGLRAGVYKLRPNANERCEDGALELSKIEGGVVVQFGAHPLAIVAPRDSGDERGSPWTTDSEARPGYIRYWRDMEHKGKSYHWETVITIRGNEVTYERLNDNLKYRCTVDRIR